VDIQNAVDNNLMMFLIRKGLKYIWALTFFLSLFFSQKIWAQSVSKISCLMPYEISISKENNEGVDFKYVEYEFHDEFTFWYKINLKDNLKFSYEITSMDDNDNFNVYFYQYDGNNFCRSFIQNNIDLISFEKKFEYKGTKGSNYYIGIFPLFPGGCGHKIAFNIGKGLINLESRNRYVSCENDEIVKNVKVSPDKATVIVSGKVSDEKTGNKINARITLVDPFTGHQEEILSNDKDGFIAELMEDGDYKVRIQAFGYLDEVTAISAYNNEVFRFTLKSSSETNYILNEVYFYPNTYALKEESIEELEGIYSYLINHPELQMKIVGHTNGNKNIKASRFVKEESEEWNFNGTAKELSLRRAAKIKDYLVGRGVNEYLILVEGKGSDEMIVNNPTNMKEAMMNIRVEIKISSHN